MRTSVIADGIGDLRDALGMVLLDGWSDTPPEPRLRLVEVPGRSGSLDLTDALGGPFFGDRKLSFSFLVRDRDYGAARARVTRALHGRRLRFALTSDPERAYVGRWSVTGCEWGPPDATVLTCEVVADPYRYRPDVALLLDPVGGRWYDLECGDMPVRPTVECATPVRVEFGGRATTLPAGSWRLNDVLLTRGTNRVYLNSWEVHDATWDYIAEDGPHPLTWDEAEGLTWDELEGLATMDGLGARTWDEAEQMTWDEAERLTWGELEWRQSDGAAPTADATVLLRYEMGDL